jgi:hypothetical protein
VAVGRLESVTALPAKFWCFPSFAAMAVLG